MLFNPFHKKIGLDLTDSAFRIATVDQGKNKSTLEGYAEIKIDDKIMQSGIVIDRTKASSLLQELINALPGRFRSQYAFVSIPEMKTFLKIIELPDGYKKNTKDFVKQIAAQHLPFPIDDMYLDWQIIPAIKNKESTRVMLGAVEKVVADNLIELLKIAKIIPLGFEVESVATARGIIPDGLPDDKQPILIIDIGSKHSTMILYDHGAIQFTSALDLHDHSLIEAIAEKTKLSYKEAAKAKRICGLDPKKGKGEVRKILLPELNDLITKIKQIEIYYQNDFSYGRDIKQVLLTGSGASLVGLDTYIKTRLKQDVAIGNSLINIEENKISKEFDAERKLSFATTVGLALKRYQGD
ncbi:pilus assembly protein PilM [Patescibacteria group bacterium]